MTKPEGVAAPLEPTARKFAKWILSILIPIAIVIGGVIGWYAR